MKVDVKTRSGKLVLQNYEIDSSDRVVELCKAITKQVPKYTLHRQRLTVSRKSALKPKGDEAPRSDALIVLERDQPLAKYAIKDGETITLKDLGPQVSWTTVFLVEYFGPILIHSMFYFYPQFVYPIEQVEIHGRTLIQTVVCALFVLHFIKREFETLFVHRFSNDTMPIRNLPKNCFHYWVLGGVCIAYPLYKPGFTKGVLPAINTEPYLWFLVALWLYSELSNLATHLILRNLRPPGTRIRNIPMGYGFHLVSCPNYLFEILGWTAVSLITGSTMVWLFNLVGAFQMYAWAVKKHKRYKADFGDKYPKGRKALIPFVL